MIKALRNAFKITDLRKRIIFTALLLIVYRLGSHVTLPGIDDQALAEFFHQLKEKGGTLIGFVDLFSGGAFSQMTIFALGIQPYISASIILQLLVVVIPKLEELSKTDDGKKKITQYTRYGTVVLAAVQGFGISFMLENPSSLGVTRSIVINPGIGFKLITIIALAAGTSFVMWLGEQIDERGIGQGISLIITAGIVASVPSGVTFLYNSLLQPGGLNLIEFVIFLALVVVAIMGTIYITLAVRKVPVRYSRKVVGRRIYGGQMTHYPLRVNAAGMIPIIFAVTLISFPSTLVGFMPDNAVGNAIAQFVNVVWNRAAIYWSAYTLLIIFFTYFYTAVQINPNDLAENLQKSGGFIPGVQPGKHTARYFERTLDRITLPSALFLAAIAVLPALLQSQLGIVQGGIAGASVLIVVGVMLDVMKRIESYLTERHYEGFMKGTKLRGRRG